MFPLTGIHLPLQLTDNMLYRCNKAVIPLPHLLSSHHLLTAVAVGLKRRKSEKKTEDTNYAEAGPDDTCVNVCYESGGGTGNDTDSGDSSGSGGGSTPGNGNRCVHDAQSTALILLVFLQSQFWHCLEL